MLPPKQACGRGYACLTCDKFATDASHQPELTAQLAATEQLVRRRQAAFRDRFGTEMSSDNVWLQGRTDEITSLQHILLATSTCQLPEPSAAPARRTNREATVSDHLVKAAKERHASATAKDEAALQDLSRRGMAINFAAVVRHARVSTDFLHRHPTLRTKNGGPPGGCGPGHACRRSDRDTTSTWAAVRAVSARMKELIRQHRQTAALRRDLAAAHGENLRLRRRLAVHENIVG